MSRGHVERLKALALKELARSSRVAAPALDELARQEERRIKRLAARVDFLARKLGEDHPEVGAVRAEAKAAEDLRKALKGRAVVFHRPNPDS